jgi:ADP-ribose pyrophosphatase
LSSFEPLGGERKFTGRIITVSVERFRHDDGEEVSREKVAHPGAVGMIALDDTHVWLVRQPREVAGLENSLEIPAGKRDVPGEEPLATAKRELAEEIGKQAGRWHELMVFYTSPGFSDERIWLFLAMDLTDSPPAQAEENERIEIVPWPLSELDLAIRECVDSKSLIALLWLARQRVGEAASATSPGAGA